MLNRKTDQTGRMPRLILVVAGHTLFCMFCRVLAKIILNGRKSSKCIQFLLISDFYTNCAYHNIQNQKNE